MESFGAHDRPSSYEAADLLGQGCNCCCSLGYGSAHLSATPGDLHPGQHSNRAGSTLWLHSLLHHDCHRTCSSCVPKPGVGWSFQQDYPNFWIILFIKTFQLSKHPVRQGLYSSTSAQEVWITIRSFRVYSKGFGQTCVFREQPFLGQVIYLFVSHLLNGLPLLLVSHCLID